MKSRFFSKDEPLYPESVVHIFEENKPVEQHNEVHLVEADSNLVSIQAIGDVPRHIKLTESQVEAIKQRKLSDTGNLDYLLKLKIGAKVMLTTNVNIKDRLVNGLVVKVMQLKVVNNEVTVIYMKCNDANAGLMIIQSDCLARQQHLIPMRKHEVSFGLKKVRFSHALKELSFH